MKTGARILTELVYLQTISSVNKEELLGDESSGKGKNETDTESSEGDDEEGETAETVVDGFQIIGSDQRETFEHVIEHLEKM